MSGVTPLLLYLKAECFYSVSLPAQDSNVMSARGGLRTHDLRISQVRGSAGLTGWEASKAYPHRSSNTL